MSVRIVSAFALAALAAMASTDVCAADRVQVFFSGSAEDRSQLSRDFIYEIKEQFGSSARMQLVAPDKTSYYVWLVAFDVQPSRDAFVYSVTWTIRTFDGVNDYLRSVAGFCPSQELRSCARSVLAETDRQLEKVSAR